nr:hypothetical protein GCM10020063_033730 [Dactylosporangium thailandense]
MRRIELHRDDVTPSGLAGGHVTEAAIAPVAVVARWDAWLTPLRGALGSMV